MHADKKLVTQIKNIDKLDEDSIKQLAQFVANNQREIHHYYHKNKATIEKLQAKISDLENKLSILSK
tara:strand:- start:85 stop:285 length:201 start_codon:yes stop_codon:yes gene_type:complete